MFKFRMNKCELSKRDLDEFLYMSSENQIKDILLRLSIADQYIIRTIVQLESNFVDLVMSELREGLK